MRESEYHLQEAVTLDRLTRYQLLMLWHDLAVFQAENDHQNAYRALVQIAAIYTRHDLFHQAIDAFKQALEIARHIQDRKIEGGILCTIGDVYSAWGRSSTAMRQYEQALRIANQLGDRQLRHACLRGIRSVEAAALINRLRQIKKTASPVTPPSRPNFWSTRGLLITRLAGRFLFLSSVVMIPVLLAQGGISGAGVFGVVMLISLMLLYLAETTSISHS